jgi:hypothetical protein
MRPNQLEPRMFQFASISAVLRHLSYASALAGLLFLLDSPTLERATSGSPGVNICVSRSGQIVVDLPSQFPFALWPQQAIRILSTIENDQTKGSPAIDTGRRVITLTAREARHLERFLPKAIEDALRIEKSRQQLVQR